MKVRLFFEPLTIEVPDDDIILDEDTLQVDSDALTTYIEENWATLVDPTEPVVGAIKVLAFTSDLMKGGVGG